MSDVIELTDVTVAEAYLRLLHERGVEYFFGNAGTDFAPLIEALSKAAEEGTPTPEPITAPHENIAVAMALGYTLVTGRPQLVMVHVNVGTANALNNLLNTSRLKVPMFFSAGRTPVLESGAPGARGGFIHWPQEMFDQAGMLREFVKWDYELRNELQLEAVVDRAFSIMQSAPAGPIYLTLPREVLSRKVSSIRLGMQSQQAPASPVLPTMPALEQAAGWIAAARKPVIITSHLGKDIAAVGALGELAERHALPVVSYNPRFVELPSDHPMAMGEDVALWVAESDLIVVLESVVPWLPSQMKPRADARVIHIGSDPLYQELPIRSFRSDLALQGDAGAICVALDLLVSDSAGRDAAAIEVRRGELARRKSERRAMLEVAWKRDLDGVVITSTMISRAIDKVKGDGLVFKEGPLKVEHMCFNQPGTLFFAGAAGGLGWSLGAALGAQLADRDRLVICCVGDGSYMFGTPLAAHYAAAEYGLPVLYVVCNNSGWHAVRRATRGMYKDGYSARAKPEPLTDFGQDMRYEHVMDVVGGYGEHVSDPAQLDSAFARALHAVRVEKRQALLNIACPPG